MGHILNDPRRYRVAGIARLRGFAGLWKLSAQAAKARDSAANPRAKRSLATHSKGRLPVSRG